ncbi:MAG TPA: nitroreductase family protein [Abditibacteriaceae bacterium]|jgi:nitroreductase
MSAPNELKDKLNREVTDEVKPYRHADYPIDPAFVNRWSPYAFSPEPIDDQTLMSVFEAARWAASSYNEQPWRFILARSDEDRKKFVDFLSPPNQIWAKNAPVLVLLIAKKTFSHNGSPNRVHQFDTGTCSGYMTLQAAMNGLYAHGMAGFDTDMARATLGIPSDFEIMAVFAIGRRGDTNDLPADMAARQVPSGRRSVSESVMEGHFVAQKEESAERDTENA